MKCDQRGLEFANSEELMSQQERVHPIGDGEDETPDMMPESEDVPEAAERRSG
ncbi:MAG TPA: hypothetical protein VNF26_04035 [Candidatus Baltobacterales bacterium]|nr:hypothetical protein [Candidatus Baltobacterales bacterium]